MVYKDTFILYKFIVDPSIDSLTVQLHEPMLLWYVRTACFATLRTLSLGLNSKQALSTQFCSAIKLLNKVSALVTWSSTDFVGINWCNWGVLLVAVTAFLCKLVSGCLLISYSPPEATLKLELHRVQNARSFPNELDCNQWCDFFHSSWNFSLMSKKEYQVPNSIFSLLIATSL